MISHKIIIIFLFFNFVLFFYLFSGDLIIPRRNDHSLPLLPNKKVDKGNENEGEEEEKREREGGNNKKKGGGREERWGEDEEERRRKGIWFKTQT